MSYGKGITYQWRFFSNGPGTNGLRISLVRFMRTHIPFGVMEFTLNSKLKGGG